MKILIVTFLMTAFILVPIGAGASGDYQKGKKTGRADAEKDWEAERGYNVREKTEVPQWRMNRIDSRSDEYIRGYRSGYLEKWEELEEAGTYAVGMIGIVVGLTFIGLYSLIY